MQQVKQEKSDFLAHMSHEIRTPKNAIIGMSDLISTPTLSTKQHNNVDIDFDHIDFCGANVLLVEDSEMNQQVAKELLELVNINILIANNGEESLDAINLKKFDAVLMDMQMPVMDGCDATREIRKNKLNAKLPIISMTANVMASDRQKCISAGMNDHVSKPIDPNELYRVLKKWIT